MRHVLTWCDACPWMHSRLADGLTLNPQGQTLYTFIWVDFNPYCVHIPAGCWGQSQGTMERPSVIALYAWTPNPYPAPQRYLFETLCAHTCSLLGPDPLTIDSG
jgi:hypothetical protein